MKALELIFPQNTTNQFRCRISFLFHCCGFMLKRQQIRQHFPLDVAMSTKAMASVFSSSYFVFPEDSQPYSPLVPFVLTVCFSGQLLDK